MKIRSSFKKLFKLFVILISIVMQVYLLFFVYFSVNNVAQVVPALLWLIRILTSLNIVYVDDKISYKISWLFFILFLPMPGVVSYLIFGERKLPKKIRQKMDEIDCKQKYFLKQNKKIYEKISNDDTLTEVELLYNLSESPVYQNTKSEYFKNGEEMFQRMLIDLKNAEKFIFMEYFIFKEGEMFDKIYDILISKAKEGVEVILIYDYFGSLTKILDKFKNSYERFNIKSYPFNYYKNSIYNFISYRDHRKITIVDGNISYCGGINIGDEYINVQKRYGYWKDMALRLEGEATFSYTQMFLKMLEYVSNEEKEIENYKTDFSLKYAKGFVVPYGDGPINNQNPAENIYKKIFANAKRYVYISTPYLEIDSDFIGLINLTSQSGADVRIIIPGIPDKKFVYKVTRSFYRDLLLKGVRIYEYKPGFIHGKVIVSDDRVCVVGSVNMDYRSLAWNFESAAYVSHSDMIIDVKNDFLDIINSSEEVDFNKYVNVSYLKKIVNSILKLIAPLI